MCQRELFLFLKFIKIEVLQKYKTSSEKVKKSPWNLFQAFLDLATIEKKVRYCKKNLNYLSVLNIFLFIVYNKLDRKIF